MGDIYIKKRCASSIAGSASQLNCFENWKTLFVFCLPSFKQWAVYKFPNLTFLWWETMKNALFHSWQFAKLIQFLILQRKILPIERLYKSSISSLSYQPRNYWVNSKYSIYSKNNLKKFELSSQLNSAWLLWTVDAVLLPKVISCATFAPPTPNFLPPLQSEANGIQCKKYIFLGNGPQKGREILNSNQH